MLIWLVIANTGLGKETVLQLAKQNPAQIYLAARTEAKANDAIASIKSSVPGANITFLPLDLTSFESIQRAASTFKASSSRLDRLVLNAGIMAVPEGKTSSGHEIQLGTNHIGHFLLTKQLLPILLKTAEEPNADVRVITLSSEAWHMAPKLDTIISTEKLSACGTWTRYGASKVANILFAGELSRRYPQLTSISLHPGMIATDLYASNKKTNPIVRYGTALLGPLFMHSVEKGAYNQLWATDGATKQELTNGAYYTPVGRLGRGNSHAKNKDDGKKLWEWTESELAKSGF
jgi:NAD(P)-dependent dehydrogenase (short-subunit alcohol dehydrogenase family)